MDPYFNGYIDEIGVWTSTLSQNDLPTLYNGRIGYAYPFGSSTLATSTYAAEARSTKRTSKRDASFRIPSKPNTSEDAFLPDVIQPTIRGLLFDYNQLIQTPSA